MNPRGRNPRRAARLAAPWVLAFTLLGVTSRARAGGSLAYRAPATCPSEAQFVAAVRARRARLDPNRGLTGGRRLGVSIRQDEGGFAGSFQVEEAAGASAPRQVRAASCADVVEGLAVVTAIALAEDAAAAPPPTSAAQAAPTTPAARAGDEHRVRKDADAFNTDVAVTAGTLRFESELTTTVAAGATMGLIPSLVLPRVDLNVFRANFATPPSALTYLVGPVVRARVSLLAGTRRTDGFSTDASGFSFGMSACRAPVYDTRGLVLLACIEYSGGFMKLDTSDAAGSRTQSKTMGMAMVGAGVEVQYNLARYFHVDLKVGGDVSFTKLTAERPDGTQLFQSQPFSAYALVGVGLHF